MFVLPFEKPIVELVEKVKAPRSLDGADQRFEPERLRLEEKTSRLAREIFADLSPIQKFNSPDAPVVPTRSFPRARLLPRVTFRCACANRGPTQAKEGAHDE
jgi:hypothetical protein